MKTIYVTECPECRHRSVTEGACPTCKGIGASPPQYRHSSAELAYAADLLDALNSNEAGCDIHAKGYLDVCYCDEVMGTIVLVDDSSHERWVYLPVAKPSDKEDSTTRSNHTHG